MHRAIDHLDLPWQRLASGVLLALAFTVLLATLRPAVAALWTGEMAAWLHALDLPARLGPSVAVPFDSDPSRMPLPALELLLEAPSPAVAALHGALVLAVWALAGRLPDAAKPGAYVLRFAALLHGAAVLYFLLWPHGFPHSASNHVMGGLRQSWALMLAVPWLHLFTYHLFPFPTWQCVALTSLSLLFLTVLAPLQYASHLALLVLLGPIVMPLLFLLLGLVVPVLGLVALYGWAMSWTPPDGEEMPR